MPLRLLLIDDDELDRRAVTRALYQTLGDCHIVQADTATKGLILAGAQQFDAILLDYRLPDQDGLDVLRILRSGTFEGVSVIMLSRQEDETLAEQCLEAGAQDFLLKDEVNGRRLSRAVRQARQRYQIETELRNSREKLRQLSEHDPLTGLINRRGFERALEQAVAQVRRNHDSLALLLLDLDDFKSVNDTLGHDAGDMLLVEIAVRLSSAVRDSDLLCRLGGDEFVILMTDFREGMQAALLATRIQAALDEPIRVGESDQLVTTSIGIAVLDTCADNAVDLFKFADVAMYHAKQDGRNQTRFFSSSLQEAVQLRATMKQDLQKALSREEFKIYYQPQIKVADNSLGGVEALLRWQHPKLGLLSPSAFMNIAEETGLIVDIGSWVLREACGQMKRWQDRCPGKHQKLSLAVNLSAVQVKSHTLGEVIKSVISAFSFGLGCLELEITESALIQDASATVALLNEITEQGIVLSLDDFGTGYSSLEHLKLFPISVLKIDRGFVSAIGQDKKGEQLLVAIIAFARALEMKVIAEGIENKEQAEFCALHGCDLLQGYYYACPIPADEFERMFLLH